MKNKLLCLRCGREMAHKGSEKLQLGETSWLFGDLSNLLSGAIEVEIYACPECRKLEFFLADDERQEELPQVKCPECGHMHDFDYPKCPYCKHNYNY